MFSPKLLNARKGFATNSSSLHSVVMIRDDSLNSVEPSAGDKKYGWDYFLLRTAQEKMEYLAIAMHYAKFDNDTIYEKTGVELHGKDTFDFYIDHDSVDILPITKGDPASVDATKTLLLMDDVAILGGNDNDETPTRFVKGTLEIPIGSLSSYLMNPQKGSFNSGGQRFIRSDNLLTIFDPKKGDKFRVSLTALGEQKPYHPVPELVDLKINSYCPYGCEYCYQGSTENDGHGSLETIKSIIDELADAGTFELAIGGGEPTLHPEFMDILRHAVERDMVPNITTRNLSLLFNKNNREVALEIINTVGAIAVSIDNLKDLNRLQRRFDKLEEELKSFEDKSAEHKELRSFIWSLRDKITIQTVAGTMNRDTFGQFLDNLYERNLPNTLTLLGYKTTGRGDEYTPHNYADWLMADLVRHFGQFYDSGYSSLNTENWSDEELLERANDERYTVYFNKNVGIDTALARQIKPTLQRYDNLFDRTMYYTDEGTLSCYIDAMTNTLAKSSYEPTDNAVPFDKDWKEQFLKIQQEAISRIPVLNIQTNLI